MSRYSILPLRKKEIEINIFSDKSSLVLFWLLVNHENLKKNGFSLNEISRLTKVSLGLTFKIVEYLVYKGIISTEGLRTNKRFYLKYADQLLILWFTEYNLLKKTKVKYFSEFDLKNIDVNFDLLPALHTAAEKLYKVKITNLKKKEFYILNWDSFLDKLKKLNLSEMDRGYDILFIKPYYKNLIHHQCDKLPNEIWLKAYTLLTIFDLAHFPLRGIEQAEALFKKTNYLNSICSWSRIENAIK